MPAPFVEDNFFFPLYNFCFFVKNQVFIVMWINIQVFNKFSTSLAIKEINANQNNSEIPSHTCQNGEDQKHQ